jgi:hypothetical protein
MSNAEGMPKFRMPKENGLTLSLPRAAHSFKLFLDDSLDAARFFPQIRKCIEVFHPRSTLQRARGGPRRLF